MYIDVFSEDIEEQRTARGIYEEVMQVLEDNEYTNEQRVCIINTLRALLNEAKEEFQDNIDGDFLN